METRELPIYKYYFYVYMYIHPEYGCIYIGQTKNLDQRYKQHYSNGDRFLKKEYVQLMREADVWYLVLESKRECYYLEEYLIKLFRPFLNTEYNDDRVRLLINLNYIILPWYHYHNDEKVTEDEQEKLYATTKK